MSLPHVLALRHIIPIGQPREFLLIGWNLTEPQSVTFTETNKTVSWTVKEFIPLKNYPNALLVVATPQFVTGHVHADTDGGGDGSLTIVVTNPPDNGDPAAPDPNPPSLPTYYTTPSSSGVHPFRG